MPRKNQKNNNISPFVKWVGGKTRVIKQYLAKYLPNKFNRYIEPFVGGGAMLCYLMPKKAIINDINTELISTYKQIKKNIKPLVESLNEYSKNHNSKLFYKTRKTLYEEQLEIASRFIYLNKTCFNGMYRVNSQGFFNVPMNPEKTKGVKLYDLNNLENWNSYLRKNKVKIYNENYLKILDKAKSGDFIYCDPPYDYEENVNGFDSYDKNSFGKQNQILLAEKLKELDKRKVKWMLSNHNTKLIRELYANFNIRNIKTNRMINSNASKRVNTGDEVIITNYEI